MTHHSLTPLWVTLTFSQSHRATRKLELVQLFCCILLSSGMIWPKLLWFTVPVDYVRDMFANKSFEYGKYGLSAYLLAFFLCVFDYRRQLSACLWFQSSRYLANRCTCKGVERKASIEVQILIRTLCLVPQLNWSSGLSRFHTWKKNLIRVWALNPGYLSLSHELP